MDAAKNLWRTIAGSTSILVYSLLLICSFLAGCNRDRTDSAPSLEEAQGTAKPRIALVMKSLANEFFSTMAKGAEEHQKKNSGKYDLIINGIKDERDISRQVAIVEEMVASGVQAIVIAPADSKALVPVLRRAREAGVVIVNIDNRLDSSVLAEEGVSIPFVGPNNRSGAKKVGDFLATNLNPGDKVAVLEGLRTSDNANQRRLGFEEAMANAGVEIVSSQTAEWEMAKANTVCSTILSEYPEVKGILAANDSMALGALAAIRSSGRKDIKVVGFDNISAVREAINSGEMLATADQHGDLLAVFGIEAALETLQNPEAAVVDRETDVDLISKEQLTQ